MARTQDDLFADEIARHVAHIVELLGYDPTDQHFAKTPQRVAKWLLDFRANGSQEDAKALLEAVFDDEHGEMVIVGPTVVNSMCAHHWLPVTGRAWVGYLPDGKVVGLSKLSRIVRHFAQQFTVQERVTREIADALMANLEPQGVMVVVEASHGCMKLRGVTEPNALTVTSAVRGTFRTELAAREEFLRLIASQR